MSTSPNKPEHIPENIVRELLLTGISFRYKSYDYRKAKAEYDNAFNSSTNYATGVITSSSTTLTVSASLAYGIPKELKEKYVVWRTGKLREIKLNPKGGIEYVKIGQHWNFCKRFILQDFGVVVKPILFKSDDKYNLIDNEFAVEDNM